MSRRSPITTHVLDTALGKPAAGLEVTLWRTESDTASALAQGRTDDDGRIADLLEPGSLQPGAYRITFETGAYLEATAGRGFYPRVSVEFTIEDPDQHYHVPLLLSPYGFSTYRGS